jgi:hypothetical protein
MSNNPLTKGVCSDSGMSGSLIFIDAMGAALNILPIVHRLKGSVNGSQMIIVFLLSW